MEEISSYPLRHSALGISEHDSQYSIYFIKLMEPASPHKAASATSLRPRPMQQARRECPSAMYGGRGQKRSRRTLNVIRHGHLRLRRQYAFVGRSGWVPPCVTCTTMLFKRHHTIVWEAFENYSGYFLYSHSARSLYLMPCSISSFSLMNRYLISSILLLVLSAGPVASPPVLSS